MPVPQDPFTAHPLAYLGFVYGAGRLIAPLFSRFSILKRSLRVALVEVVLPLVLLDVASVTFSFSSSAEDPLTVLKAGLTILARGLVAKMDSFCRLSINFGRSSNTCTLPVRINGVNPTELEANRRYGESSFVAPTAEDEVDGCGEAAISDTSDNLRLAVLLRLSSASFMRVRS